VTVRAVTAVYDIRRSSEGDGRQIADYFAWLNRTLALPVPFTIFLDPATEHPPLATKPGDVVIPLPWTELAALRWRAQVEEVCRHAEQFPSWRDLTYRLPAYQLLMFSKFEFFERVAANTAAESLVWIDAGASRFSDWDYSRLRLREEFASRLAAHADLAVSARHHLRDYYHGRPAPSFPGLCQTLTNGTAFLVKTSAAARLRRVIDEHVESNWLAHDLWDTEQTALGEIILAGKMQTAIVAETFNWIGLLGVLFKPIDAMSFGQRWDQNATSRQRPLVRRAGDVLKANIIKTYRSARYGRPVDEIAAIIPGPRA